MTFDRVELAGKLKRCRDQLLFTVEEVAQATGIDAEVLKRYEAAGAEPTGDEILILADLYKCDFKFFISNERKAPFEQAETLFGGLESSSPRQTGGRSRSSSISVSVRSSSSDCSG